MDLNYLKQLSAYEVLGKLFVRKNKDSEEHMFVYFDTRMTLECLICSDGGKYDFNGNHLYKPEFSIVAESKYYGRFNHLEAKPDEIPHVASPEKAKLQLQKSLKLRLKEDIDLFNDQLSESISNGNGLFWVNLPSVERVKQLAEFVSSKGYAVKAIQGLSGTFIEVQL